MALDKVLLGRLLQLNEPWTVRDFRFDPGARRIDAWIGLEVQRGWFGLARKQEPEAAERVWRHIDLAGWRCHLRVLAPPNADLSSLPWAGPADMPFSQALSKQVFALFNEGVSLNGICAITGIPLQEPAARPAPACRPARGPATADRRRRSPGRSRCADPGRAPAPNWRPAPDRAPPAPDGRGAASPVPTSPAGHDVNHSRRIILFVVYSRPYPSARVAKLVDALS